MNNHELYHLQSLYSHVPSEYTIFVLFNAVKSLLVHLYSHAHVFSQVSFILLQLLYL